MYSKKDCWSTFSIVIYSNPSPINNDLEHILGVNVKKYRNIYSDKECSLQSLLW
jgi:hypothetical protein